jgi:hypothetical protein
LPAELPDYYSPGSASEAVLYAAETLPAWKATPGAAAWLRTETKPRKKKKEAPPAQGPLPLVKKRLERLPRHSEVWQADFRQLPIWVGDRGEEIRPWVVLIADPSSGLILGQRLVEQAPTTETLWDTLAEGMQRPLMGRPHRPARIEVGPDERWTGLEAPLAELGVTLARVADLPQIQSLLEGLGNELAGDAMPSFLEGPGVTPELARAFYEAAAEYYRRAPWRSLGYEAAIRVECPSRLKAPRFAVPFGQSGMTYGLALYDDWKTLQRLWQGGRSDEENARMTKALAVTFGDQTDIAAADLDACRRFGWPVAGPDAYPFLIRQDPDLAGQPPEAGEVELMAACLQAVPDFVSHHPPDDSAREETTLQVPSGELRLILSWVEDD